ncbi:MAG: alpha/beta fold hydrolase [Novosphingobium sp.]
MVTPPDHGLAPPPKIKAISTNGMDLQVIDHGAGIPLLLLHGFPDHAMVWRPLLERLGGSCRMIAPDQRGYRHSTRPDGVEAYTMDQLVADLTSLLEALELPRVHVCGHDWGGVLAFALATQRPDLIAGVVALNTASAGVLQDMIWNDPGQRAASQYITRLRSPEADAIFCEANVEILIERFLGDPRQRGLLSEADIAIYREAWTQPGVWQAMLAWYRAAPFDVPAPDVAPDRAGTTIRHDSIDCPVLVIWGDRDTVFVPAMADAIAAVCPDCTVVHLPDAGHVPQRDAPDACAGLIADFLTQHPIPALQRN